MESVNKKMSEVEGQTEDLAGRDISSVTCTDCPPICSHPALGFWSFNAGLVLRGVVQKSNKRRKSTCYCQRDQDQRGAARSVWALFQLMQDYHCAPTQIYLCALIFPSHPLVSAETFPWHLAFTSKELGLPCRSEAGEERWQQSLLARCRVEGYRCVEGLVTPMLRTGCTYMWCVPQCGVSLTQTPFPPSVHRTMEYFVSEGTFEGYLVQIRMLNVVLSSTEAFNYIMCGLEVEGHV